jgi:hypothetical protein
VGAGGVSHCEERLVIAGRRAGTGAQPLQGERAIGMVRLSLTSAPYSHSIVPGGFEVMSYTTRFTPRTSLTMRLEITSNRS